MRGCKEKEEGGRRGGELEIEGGKRGRERTEGREGKRRESGGGERDRQTETMRRRVKQRGQGGQRGRLGGKERGGKRQTDSVIGRVTVTIFTLFTVQNRTCIEICFIFRRRTSRELATIGCDDEQSELL